MKRLTLKWLKDWVNEQFDKLEIKEYRCCKIERTYFRSQDYEAGASKLLIHFKLTEHPDSVSIGTFYSFYSLRDFQDHISKGYEMYLKVSSHKIFVMSNLEIELRKKN